MNKNKIISLSKTISYALRHNPSEFNLTLDKEGWTPVQNLLQSLNKIPKWKDVTLEDLEYIVESDDKQRYVIQNGNIRAYYGHSISDKIEKIITEPPEILLHGTTSDALLFIKKQGIVPMSRQYVHLSSDEKIAYNVGKRRTKEPIILKIKAKEAFKAGINFYQEGNVIWLSDKIPIKYIENI